MYLKVYFVLIVIVGPLKTCVQSRSIEEYEANYNEIHRQADVNARNALSLEEFRWPEKEIYYRISNDFGVVEALTVRAALKLFNRKTCLKFKRITEVARNRSRYVLFKKSKDGCKTPVGYQPDQSKSHDVFLSDVCALNTRTIQHETLHVLGLYHEQSRHDRDKYVEIIYDNIDYKQRHNFDIEPNTTSYGLDYDYDSIMHYDSNAFAKDPSRPTIRARINGTIVDREFGQNKEASELDLEKIRIMYKCPRKVDVDEEEQ